jgi:hypothetical protein
MGDIDPHPDTSGLEIALKRLLDKIWATKGSRFNAHRRLLGKHSASQFALAVLSIYAIAASVATLILPQAKYPNLLPAMSAGTVVASVFILVQSLLESAKNYQLRAHQMQRCGEKLSEMYNVLSAERDLGIVTQERYLAAVENYSEILADYPENHGDIDYLLFTSQHRRKDRNTTRAWFDTRWQSLKNVVHMWGSSSLYIAAPPIAIFGAARWLQLY